MLESGPPPYCCIRSGEVAGWSEDTSRTIGWAAEKYAKAILLREEYDPVVIETEIWVELANMYEVRALKYFTHDRFPTSPPSIMEIEAFPASPSQSCISFTLLDRSDNKIAHRNLYDARLGLIRRTGRYMSSLHNNTLQNCIFSAPIRDSARNCSASKG